MFGKNLKKIRSVRNLSQQEFADIFDLKRATLGAYEEQRSNPKLETVMKIANHFSISIDDLLTKELTVNRLLRFNEAITTETGRTEDGFEGIKCVTPEMKDTFIHQYANALSNQDLPVIKLPYVKGADKMAFVVDDLTMSAGLHGFYPKDVVIGTTVSLQDIASLNGELAVVLTEDSLHFRKVTLNATAVMLTANHPGVEPLLLNLSQIKAVWNVVHVFKYTLLSNTNAVEQRLQQLENTLAGLQQKP